MGKELIRFLSDELSLPMAAVHIESSEGSRHKRVRLEGTTADHVIRLLLKRG
jgi:uncharacterized protein YggU (UPF0235/DUF167 family)